MRVASAHALADHEMGTRLMQTGYPPLPAFDVPSYGSIVGNVTDKADAAIGGATGVFIAWAIGRIVTAVFFPTYLSIAAVVIAVGISGLIGVLSGILPARKAATLDPIEALRAD